MKQIFLRAGVLLLMTTSFACNKTEGTSLVGVSSNPPTTQSQSTSVARLATGSGAFAKATASGYSDKRSCTNGWGDCALCINDEEYVSLESQMPVELSFESDNTLRIDYKRELKPLDKGSISLTQNLVISDIICSKLGVSSIVIMPGNYPLNLNGSAFGNVTVNVIVTE